MICDDAEFIPHELHGAATPKQVAYLTYMGVKNAQGLTKQQAHELIESNRFFPEPNSLAEFERQRAYQVAWQTKRLVLDPDIYAVELKEFLSDTLPEQLHTYVRGQIVGASERLTKSKIRDVINVLTSEDACWWHQADYETVFLERLRQMYPGCCDGRSPDTTPRRVTARAVYSPARPPARAVKGSGCLVLLSVVFLFVLLCMLLMP